MSLLIVKPPSLIPMSARDGDFDTTDLKIGHFAAQSVLLLAEEALNASSAGSIFSAPATIGLAAAVAAAQLTVNTLENQIKEKDDALDACNLSVSDESYAFAQFLACPYTNDQQLNAVFIGQGCDGMDNDCDSDIDASGTIKSVVSSPFSVSRKHFFEQRRNSANVFLSLILYSLITTIK